jgi:3-oxoacyl-[acyl-carrier protein] reductase
VPYFDLSGKVAIVTGGGSGMGREIALEYAASGAAVVVASNVAEQDEAVAHGCREEGGRALAVPTDVRDEAAVGELVARAVDEFGHVDVLVAAAGIDVTDAATPADTQLARVQPEQWRRVLDVNLTGTWLAARAVVPHMVEHGSGSIVTFSTSTVRNPLPGLGPYIASKFAVEGLTKVLALETVDRGLRVNAMQPGGPTDTGLFPPWVTDEQRAGFHRPGVVRALAAYLASDESRYVTGRSLVASDWNKERGIALCSCAACTTVSPRPVPS